MSTRDFYGVTSYMHPAPGNDHLTIASDMAIEHLAFFRHLEVGAQERFNQLSSVRIEKGTDYLLRFWPDDVVTQSTLYAVINCTPGGDPNAPLEQLFTLWSPRRGRSWSLIRGTLLTPDTVHPVVWN
jgi:hypothetical protein